LVSETSSQAESWTQARRVAYKAEALEKGPHTRFAATSRPDIPVRLYNIN